MSDLSPAVVVDRIISCLMAGAGERQVAAIFEHQLTGLALILDPREADLPVEQLRAVLRVWQALPRVEGVADVLKVQPEQLIDALGYIMLVDVGDADDDFRYTLYGSKIARVSGFDMTGKTVWDVATTPVIQVFFAACYMTVRHLRRPLYTVHDAPVTITVSQWHRLILPLGQGGEVKRFLVCNIPIHGGQVR